MPMPRLAPVMKIVRAFKDMIHRLHGLHGCTGAAAGLRLAGERGSSTHLSIRIAGAGESARGIWIASVNREIRGRNILARDERTRRHRQSAGARHTHLHRRRRAAAGVGAGLARGAQWFNGKLAELGLEPAIDAAGNSWATLAANPIAP